MTSTVGTRATKSYGDGKEDTKNSILNILRLLDLNKVNRLKILNFIAEGGFGSVSTCTYEGTEFLIKTLKTIELKAYLDEFKLTYKYRNPGIPKVIAAYEPDSKTLSEDSTVEIGVMFEFINGQTLNGLLYKREKGKKKKQDFTIPLISRIYYMIQLTSCMSFLHDQNLVHRDLKPDNLIIDCFNNLKVIDFGISIPHNTVIDLTSTSNSYTMKYVPVDLKFREMSSSIEDSDKQLGIDENLPVYYQITKAFDVWCVGLILCEVLLGGEPWGGKSEDRIIGLICEIEEETKNDFEYPIPKADKISIDKEQTKEKLIKLVKNCTKFDPEARMTMREINLFLWEIFKYEVKSDYLNNITKENKDQEKFKEFAKQIIEQQKIGYRRSDERVDFENPLITLFKNSIRYAQSEIYLLNEKMTEIENSLLELEENSYSSNIKGKQYVYMTYNEFDDSIVGLVFPENKQVIKHSLMMNLYITKNYKMKNPSCLNYNNKLYMIGGMIIDTKLLSTNDSYTENIVKGTMISSQNFRKTPAVNNLQKEYLEIFGSNYFKTRKVLCFNYFDDKINQLPDMNVPRAYASGVIYKNQLVVAGDDDTVEMLDIGNIENSNFFSVEQWKVICTLQNKVYSPLFVNWKNSILYIISQFQQSGKCQNTLQIQYIKGISQVVTSYLVDIKDSITHDVQLRGVYYNFSIEDIIFVFASGFIEGHLKHYIIELAPMNKRSVKYELVGIREIYTENPFNIEIEKTLRKFSKQNIKENNPIQMKSMYEKLFKFDNSFFIHDSLQFYEYDDNLYYYTMNILKTGLTIRQFNIDTIK